MQGMGFKSHDYGRAINGPRPVDDTPEDFTMTQMDAIKVADRYNCPARLFF